MKDKIYRGSRKHVLDWVQSPRVRDELNDMIAPTGAIVRVTDWWIPVGYDDPDECRLDQTLGDFLPADIREKIGNWWLHHRSGRANTPNWDLVANCQIEGRSGLILVEAKANKNEMHTTGKAIQDGASENSKANHARIGEAIEEARRGFEEAGWSLGISRDRCYQLSNRLAFTWKLASCGIPVVLIYLGFLADEGIADAGPPLASHQDWLDYFDESSRDVLPDGFGGREVRVGNIPAWLILRSRQVMESSPPAPGPDLSGKIDPDIEFYLGEKYYDPSYVRKQQSLIGRLWNWLLQRPR